MPTDQNRTVPYTPGEQVAVVGNETQAVVGFDHGVVVGDTVGQPATDEVKVVVTPQASDEVPNAVISPADLQIDPLQHE